MKQQHGKINIDSSKENLLYSIDAVYNINQIMKNVISKILKYNVLLTLSKI